MVDPPLVIRKATASNLPELNALERATFTQYAISPRQMASLSRLDSAIVLVARKGKDLAGDGIALVRHHAGKKITGRIYSLVVDPRFRGQGIGQKLLRRLISRLKSRNVSRIYLEVELEAYAVAIYQKLGFRITRSMRHYYGRWKHGLKMVLEL